ncbi:putative tRNA-His guanylyltransferase [Xanthomonas phage XbC2]|nr:putative tRNA-His guanylyltransferase [Xanthomonas phage XbC2]
MNLGDRIKHYEKMETTDKFMPMLPIVARLDGRSFSKFTKSMVKPFDIDMTMIMQAVTKYLVEESGAEVGYTQSDEITLVFWQRDYESDVFFAGKKQKMVSVLASLATAMFVKLALQHFPEECSKRLPHFDCRVFQVPSRSEATNAVLWRVQDAVRNSISMAAHATFGHSKLQGKSTNNKLDMLLEAGINWNDYPKAWKEGSFFKRQNYIKMHEGNEVIRSHVTEVLVNQKFEDLSTLDRMRVVFGDEEA